MVSSDFRKEARLKLTGKWGKAACIVLAYLLVSFAIGFVQGLLPKTGIIAFIASVVAYAIEIPLAFGTFYAFFKLYCDEDVTAFSFWTLGFDNFKKSWGITLKTLLKLIVPLILAIASIILSTVFNLMSVTNSLIVSSSNSTYGFLSLIFTIVYLIAIVWLISKSYYYSLAQCVAFDNPDLTSTECIEKSKELMTNNRGKLFCLQLSFIGWAILAAFTFGIGFLWLVPYMQVATVAFYDKLAH